MQEAPTLTETVELCRRGNFDADQFALIFWSVRSLLPNASQDLEEHLGLLLSHGDRLAAVILLLPPGWGFSLQRSCNGRSVASARQVPTSVPQFCEAEDEAAALLGALATALLNPTLRIVPRELHDPLR